MKILFIRVVNCLQKKRNASSSDDTGGTEVQQATNLDLLFLIQLKSYGFAIFQIVSIK